MSPSTASGPPPTAGWSLVRRLSGGVVLIAILSLAAQAWVLNLWLQPLAHEARALATEQAVLVRAALLAVPSHQRPALASQLSGERLQLSRQEPDGLDEGPPPPPPADWLGIGPLPPPPGWVMAPASPGIQLFPLRRSAQGAALAFRLSVDGEDWWLRRPMVLPTGALSGTLAVWTALLALATLGALLVSVRMIARPIGQLAHAMGAQQTRQGLLQPLPVRSQDSAEIQALVHAFNTLAQQHSQGVRTRQQLLAGVSHDLRTPLARLRLRAETQCEGALSDALLADLLALEHIVNQFLAYVQGDTGLPDGPKRALHDVVLEVVREVQPPDNLAAAGGALQVDVDPVALPVPPLAVRRLLSNLIENARLYGGSPVGVQLRATAAGAALRVSDAGSGMSAPDFLLAQQPFVRLSHTRGELGHCGLGLAIVAQLAQQLGGTLASDTDAQGRFGITLTLPWA